MKPLMFSTRTEWDLEESDLAAAVRQAGSGLLDLTVVNPTECGFAADDQALALLADPQALRYRAEALGTVRARESVAAYYADTGAEVGVERLCLTTSTSEAYSFLFRLLCGAGDEVLVARPSYPLFEFLARLDDVTLREYPLHYDPGAVAGEQGWLIDLQSLEEGITERTRAVIVVHPNNPTGNYASEAERVALQRLCAERGLALIVDEVFLDYSLGEERPRSFAADESACLCFVLSGLSKVCALPQMKLSWIATSGPKKLVDEAMQRLEMIADTFLSVNSPVQFALPNWLAQRAKMQESIRARMRTNLQVLDETLRGSPMQRLEFQGGWTAVLRVPRTIEGKAFVFWALERGVVVQPGDFYGLSEGRVVVSLLTSPGVWGQGLARLVG